MRRSETPGNSGRDGIWITSRGSAEGFLKVSSDAINISGGICSLGNDSDEGTQPPAGRDRLVAVTSRVFLISFGARPADQSPQSEDFTLNVGRRATRVVAVRPRPGQARFRFFVFKRYGPTCALCGLAVPALLEAVHLCGVAQGGSDDPRNGLVLCCNHHRAFDERLFGFDPSTTRLEFSPGGPNAAGLGIRVEGLDHLAARPHAQALGWCWEQFRRAWAEPTVARDPGDR